MSGQTKDERDEVRRLVGVQEAAIAGLQQATAAIQSAVGSMPTLATTLPVAEGKTASAGSMNTATRADHVHPRLTSTASGTLNAAGEATITFTRTFPMKPAVIITPVESAEAQPLVFKVKAWLNEGGTAWQPGQAFGGCVIKGYRSQALPAISSVSGLLTAVITGVNALVSALSNFNVFGGSAAGAEYSLIALMPSTP